MHREIFPGEELATLQTLDSSGVMQHPLVLFVGGDLGLELIYLLLVSDNLLGHCRIYLE